MQVDLKFFLLTLCTKLVIWFRARQRGLRLIVTLQGGETDLLRAMLAREHLCYTCNGRDKPLCDEPLFGGMVMKGLGQQRINGFYSCPPNRKMDMAGVS